jgi:PadR family transcriptional regulator AphA
MSYNARMSLRHAILGFLALRPMTGYDLRKQMAGSVGHFWPADQAQIYRTLAGLVADGLVEVATVEQQARPNRRLHRIRPEGSAELDRWLAAAPALGPGREPFLLHLFFGGRLGSGPIRALLEGRVAEAEAQIAALGAVEGATRAAAGQGLEARLRLATLENGLAHARAERDWALALVAELEEEPDHG